MLIVTLWVHKSRNQVMNFVTSRYFCWEIMVINMTDGTTVYYYLLIEFL